MAKFHIGQRVRIKWSVGFPELNGTEGTIVGPYLAEYPNYSNGERGDWVVAPDCWGDSKCPYIDNMWFGPSEYQLEPLTDSYDKISWEECMWKPEHLREYA